MPTIYLDHNIIAIAAGLPLKPTAPDVRARIGALLHAGHRFALSAWNAFELAQSQQQDHVHSCCAFIESINPIWVSNGNYVKRKELKRFLSGAPDHRIPALSNLVSQMWATYGDGAAVTIGETFTNTVRELRGAPEALATVQAAARMTPEAIEIGRQARDDGRLAANADIVDREYFAMLLGSIDRDALDHVMGRLREVLAACPAIAVENRLTQIRVSENFNPEPGDAADLQHAIVGLAYCDHFVSDDKMLVEHCRRAVRDCGLRCGVHRSVAEVP